MSVGYSSGSVALFVCARCARELPYSESYADPDKGPSLRVCWRDRDALDPWKLPGRQMENISLQYPRSEPPLTSPLAGLLWDSPDPEFWDAQQYWDMETIGQPSNPLSE